MPTKKKNSSKTELFWDRFEKSGSIDAYLRYHKAKLDAAIDGGKVPAKAKKPVRSLSPVH